MTASTPNRLSPVQAAASALGARYIAHAGWQVPEVYSSVDAELAAARAGVALVDVSSLGKLYVEGAAAADTLRAAFGSAPEAVGAGVRVAGLAVFQIRPDLFFLLTATGAEAEAEARLSAARQAFVTVTDVTHGLAGLGLLGPRARGVLGQLSALNLDPAAFPDLHLRSTSVAKTRQLLVRQDRGGLPVFYLFGAQSLAVYVWDVIRAAGQAAGLVPLGLNSFLSLEG
jgi:heterotetrameric sarcosine oxidase gamma subunit